MEHSKLCPSIKERTRFNKVSLLFYAAILLIRTDSFTNCLRREQKVAQEPAMLVDSSLTALI